VAEKSGKSSQKILRYTEGRMMNIGEKLLNCLRTAGADGLSSAQLAENIYGQSDSTERGRIACLIGALRRKGFAIVTIITFGRKGRQDRYILYEKAALSDGPEHTNDDVPSPRSHPGYSKRGAR
jgi:hypothetical protein